MVAFSFGSLLCGLAPGVPELIGARPSGAGRISAGRWPASPSWCAAGSRWSTHSPGPICCCTGSAGARRPRPSRPPGGDLAGGKRTAADLGAWLCFEDESGQGLRPPKGRARGRRGHTPVVKVTGASNRLGAAHQQLGGPVILVWDNLNTHISHAMRELTGPGLLGGFLASTGLGLTPFRNPGN